MNSRTPILPLRIRFSAGRKALLRRIFEPGANIDTGEAVDLVDLGYAHPDRRDYRACGWRAIKRSLALCDVKQTDVFVDIGCGMGRVVAQAARQDFARVIGVELSPELAAKARLYLKEVSVDPASVEILNEDATKWQLPDDVTVVFLNNPFVGEILQAVIDNVVASLDRADRPLQLVYVNPREPERLIATGKFETIKEVRQGKAGDADDILLMHHTPE